MIKQGAMTITLINRELFHFLVSPVTFVSALFLIFGSCIPFFVAGSAITASATAFRQFVSIVPYVSAIVISVLTMGLWSDEEKTGTCELIFSYPIRDETIIVAKFCAVFLVYILFLVLTIPVVALSPVAGSAHRYVSAGPGSVAAAYVLLILSGSTFCAVGLFFSVLLKHAGASLFCSSAVLLTFTWLTFPYHFEAASRGMLDSRDIVFYLIPCVVVLYIAAFFLSARRRSL